MGGSCAAAQAAWRFYTNERASLVDVAQPLIESSRQAAKNHCTDFALVVHDWSGLSFTKHESKRDRIEITHQQDVGYELQSAVLLSDVTGNPLGVLYQAVRAAGGLYSTRSPRLLPPRSHLDELSLVMRHVEALEVGKPLLHIIDQEADSVYHLRRWERERRAILVRADDVRRVLHQGQEKLLSTIVEELERATSFKFVQEVEVKGKRGQQMVAESVVTLHRAARLHRKRGTAVRRRRVIGKAISLRLVISQIRSRCGELLAQWLLWTNLPGEISPERVALWYYWRWKIESFFKLLKRGGQHVEQWQQESAGAVAKRLLVATQACVMVWALAESQRPEAEPIRKLLVGLSGRLMKRGQAYTRPALLSGMWVWLAMVDTLERYSVAEIRRMSSLLPQLLRLDSG